MHSTSSYVEAHVHVISIIHIKAHVYTAVSVLTRSTPTITRLCHIYSPGNCHSITRPARCACEREVRGPVIALSRSGTACSRPAINHRTPPAGLSRDGTRHKASLSSTKLGKWANATLN